MPLAFACCLKQNVPFNWGWVIYDESKVNFSVSVCLQNKFRALVEFNHTEKKSIWAFNEFYTSMKDCMTYKQNFYSDKNKTKIRHMLLVRTEYNVSIILQFPAPVVTGLPGNVTRPVAKVRGRGHGAVRTVCLAPHSH